MYSSSFLLALAATISAVSAHGAILKAVGDSGASQGFLVDQTLARNCTTISPCQQDSVIIRDAEITQNIVNECGRTEINGNIDVGEQTENELAAGRMTQVSGGTVMKVTIHQVNADGAGPYECDLDQTSNAGPGGNIPLKVTNNIPGENGISQAKEQDFTINVELPQNLNCIGASTGDICTVRCRNNALAGPFGGCFPVQQTDGGGRENSSAAALLSANPPAATSTAANGNNNNNNNNNNGNGKGKANGKGNGKAANNQNANNANGATGNGNAATGKGNGKNGNNANGNAQNAGQNAATGNGNANAATGATGQNAATGNGNANGNGKGKNNGNANGKGKNNGNNAQAAGGNAANTQATNGQSAAAGAAGGNGGNGKGKNNNKLRRRRSAKFLIRD